MSSPGVSHVIRSDRGLLVSGRNEYSLLSEEGKARWTINRPFGALRIWGAALTWFGEIAGSFCVAELDWSTGQEIRRRPLTFVPMIELGGGEALGYGRDARKATLLRAELWGDGSPRWSRLSIGPSAEWDPGAALWNDSVFVGCGQSLVCLSAETGVEKWQSTMKPVEVDRAHGKMWPVAHGDRVISNGAWGIIAFDAKTGLKAWHHMHPCWKTIAEGKVHCLSEEYSVLDARTGNVLVSAPIAKRILAKFGAKGSGEWRGGVNFARPAIWGNHVYFGDDDGRLWAIERDTGEPVWFHKPEGCAGYLNAEPVVDGNRLYITSFSMDPKRPPRLYCYERASDDSVVVRSTPAWAAKRGRTHRR